MKLSLEDHFPIISSHSLKKNKERKNNNPENRGAPCTRQAGSVKGGNDFSEPFLLFGFIIAVGLGSVKKHC